MEKQLNPNNICCSKYGGMLELMSSEDLPSYCFYNPWDINNNNNNHNNHNIHNHDQNDLFDSALSSIVSSPVTASAPPPSGDGVMIKELIGRLGTICDSDTNNNNNNNSNSNCNSGYNTPINSSSSPTNINLMMSSGRFNCPIQSSLGSLNADPGFVERAAKYSCFGNFNHPPPNLNHNLESGKLSRVNSDKRLGERENNGDSREGSSVSEQNPGGGGGGGGSGGVAAVKAQNDGNSRKRKTVSKAKIKETPSSSPPTSQDEKIEVENDETNAKRSKVEDDKKENGEQNNNAGETSKPEPLKDYIHVRARRGQATDSHSLAERVRREKISERMKFLQDLVPGCNKVTGKATVLDEIINYVQSLQRQVEFLSMKLSTVNPRVEFNMEALLSKEMLQSRGSSMQQAMYQVDQNSAQAFPYGYQSTQQLSLPSPNGAPNRNENHFSGNPMNGNGIRRNPAIPLPLIDGFVDPMTQMSNLWEDDLQSIVQMGITQNQSQSVPAGTMPNAQMKIEL